MVFRKARIGTRIAATFAVVNVLFLSLIGFYSLQTSAVNLPVLLAALVIAAVSGVLVWLLTQSILKPLHRTVSIAKRVTLGDLSFDAKIEGHDEISDLHYALKEMNDSLRGIVEEVRDSAASVTGASNKIASDSSELSERTASQASSLEETASAMEEMSAAVAQNAESARRVNDLARKASDAAIHGGKVVASAAQEMTAIQYSNRQIVDVISVINSVAFQTNILALNAAVEAARAGEQGRGFAVVASEVRSLAQRTAEAAKHVNTLIGESTRNVASGAQMVGQAGSAMSQIVESITTVAKIIGEITQGSQEQSQGIAQVNTAISQIDGLTQHNAALVETTATAAANMKLQAEQLAKVISIFRLEDNRVEAIAMVERAVTHVGHQGQSKALADFSQPTPAFKRGDLYINVIDMEGNTLAHGENSKLIGRKLIDLKDANGKPFIREFINTASAAGHGWVDYQWANPVTGVVEEKATYVQRLDSLIIGCGIYRG